MPIKIIKTPIKKSEIEELASEEFGDVVKIVVDVGKEIIAVGGELHSDEEIILIEEEGSLRENTWGINFYPFKTGDEQIEFDCLINLKPSFGNRSRDIENPETKEKIKQILKKLIVD